MKYSILLVTLILMACGGSKGSNSQGAQGNNQVTPSPSPSPTPDPFVGTWKGQDYSLSFQDLVVLNSDGTGSEVACDWGFNWEVDPNTVAYPNTLDVSFTSWPASPINGCQDVSQMCGGNPVDCSPDLRVTYTWNIDYTDLSLENLLESGVGYAYFLQ